MTWTDIYFTRHGEAVSTRAGRLVSRGDDGGLTERGRQQANAAAAFISARPVAAVYTSPLRRARETASVIAAPHRLVPVLAEEAAEIDFGKLDGSADRSHRCAVEDQINRWCDGSRAGGIPAGEDLPQLIDRTGRLLSKIHAAHPSESVALVGHGGTLQPYLQHVADDIGRTLAWHYFPNCAIAHLRVREVSSGLQVTVMDWLANDPQEPDEPDSTFASGVAALWPAGLGLVGGGAPETPRKRTRYPLQALLLREEPPRRAAERLLIAERLAGAGLLALRLVRPSSGRLGVPVRGGLWTVWHQVPHRRLGRSGRPRVCGATMARAHILMARLRQEVPLLATAADGLGRPELRLDLRTGKPVISDPWGLGSSDMIADLSAWRPRGRGRQSRLARAAFAEGYRTSMLRWWPTTSDCVHGEWWASP
ncbi:histidine phosphatase family protein [Micromonospora sp. NPDC049060]|uniref:histidine phosphatase family protein n=1 Tax=Micromonospora sp. NPDC049060 TaxID=3154828 RepID=UPI0033E162EA